MQRAFLKHTYIEHTTQWYVHFCSEEIESVTFGIDVDTQTATPNGLCILSIYILPDNIIKKINDPLV